MSFGADTDYWGFADTNIKLQSSSKTPSKSEAQCVDSNGDVSASTLYDTYDEFSCVYRSCGDTALVFYDTASAVDFRLGKVISNKVITSISVSTDNTSRPEITIAGRDCATADGAVRYFAPTDLEIAGARTATPIGASADTVSKVTGSNATASANVAVTLDSNGAESCLDLHGGRVEATVDVVGCTGDAGVSADTGWSDMGAGLNKENTAYSTGSISVFKNLAGSDT